MYRGTRIRLVFGSDSLCAHCPHHTADDLCESQDKVSRFDRKTVEYFDLHEGEYVYQDLIRAIDTQIDSAATAGGYLSRMCMVPRQRLQKEYLRKMQRGTPKRCASEAVEKLRFPNSLSLETTLSSDS